MINLNCPNCNSDRFYRRTQYVDTLRAMEDVTEVIWDTVDMEIDDNTDDRVYCADCNCLVELDDEEGVIAI